MVCFEYGSGGDEDCDCDEVSDCRDDVNLPKVLDEHRDLASNNKEIIRSCVPTTFPKHAISADDVGLSLDDAADNLSSILWC